MTGKNLIQQLQTLKEIKPREEWVLLTKENIFKEEPAKGIISIWLGTLKELRRSERFVFNHKPAFAFALSLLVAVGLFGFAQGSMPGDMLFSLKKITEKGQAALFVSDKNKTRYDLEMVSKRLNDIAKAAQADAGKNLGPAINEYKESASTAAKSLAKSNDLKEITAEVKKIEEQKQEIQSLGVKIDENAELDNALASVVQKEIDSFDGKQLTQESQAALEKAKIYFVNGKYSDALEKLMGMGM